MSIVCHQEPISKNELKALNDSITLIERLSGRARYQTSSLTNVCSGSLYSCYTPKNVVEECPVYFLDAGTSIIIVSCEWLYDSHVMHMSESMFDKWDGKMFFPKNFVIRFHQERGVVFSCDVKDESIVPIQTLPQPISLIKLNECMIIDKTNDNIIYCLIHAGIAKTEE